MPSNAVMFVDGCKTPHFTIVLSLKHQKIRYAHGFKIKKQTNKQNQTPDSKYRFHESLHNLLELGAVPEPNAD